MTEGAEPAEMQANQQTANQGAEPSPPVTAFPSAERLRELKEAAMPGAELPRKHFYAPKPGMRWNPLRDWPRNEQCFCGSKKKAKKCHLPHLTECVKYSEADLLDKYIADYRSGKAVMPLTQGKP